MTSQEKSRYRRTSDWRFFRKSALKRNCELCGSQSKKLHLHHRDPEHYDRLEPELFSTLCGVCHRFIEHHARKKKLSDELKVLISRFFI
jgi:hypothetical protein